MVSPQVYCDIEEVLMWFGGKDYSNRTVGHAFEVAEIERVDDMERHVQRLNSYFGFMKYRLTYAIRWRLFNAIPEKIKKKTVCVNMQKFQIRHSDNTTKKVA